MTTWEIGNSVCKNRVRIGDVGSILKFRMGFPFGLRGPAAILFISRDTCSDSIAKLFRACFMGYRTIIARYVAKWGIAQMCLCESQYQGGVSHHFGGVLISLKKYRAIWGIAAIVSQYRAIWGHKAFGENSAGFCRSA